MKSEKLNKDFKAAVEFVNNYTEPLPADLLLKLYAYYKIANKNPNANIIVAPSDHLILKENEFIRVMNLALDYTSKHNDLVTLGITPTRPDTGYGYIQFSENSPSEIKPVKMFAEKPTLEKANEFIASGDFCWNSGMFIWNLNTIQTAFEKLLPSIDQLFKKGIGKYNTPSEHEFIQEIYPICESISIDYGIMESSSNVHVISADIGWSDLGTWGSIYTHLPLDENKNAIVGENVMLYNANNNIVNVPKEKLVVLQGLDNYIVVESDTILLVCQKSEEQKIKQFVADVKATKDNRFY